MIVPLSIRVAADTPSPSLYLINHTVKEFCLRLFVRGSASEFALLRGYFYVHFRYNPDSCSPAYCRLCRWASEGNVSTTPCHPSYMAPAFTTTGLSPVRKQYPSLGTPLIKVRPLLPLALLLPDQNTRCCSWRK